MLFMFSSFDLGLFDMMIGESLMKNYKLKQSRVHESRADEWGLMMIHRCGFDIDEGPKMIKRMHKGIKKATA